MSRGARGGLIAFAWLAVRVAAPSLMPLFIIAAGAWLAGWLPARVSADPRVRWWCQGGYAVKVAAAAFLYMAAAYQWPVFRAYQLEGGFWSFAWDALIYDTTARRILAAWAGQGAWPSMGPEALFSLHTAALYLLFGAHPLIPALFNAWYALAATCLAVKLMGRMAASAWPAAALLSLWPTPVLWASQNLKEWAVLCGLLAGVEVIARVRQQLAASGSRGWIWSAALLALVVLLCGLRVYIGLSLAGAAALVLGIGAWRAPGAARGRAGLAAAGVLIAALGASQPLWRDVWVSTGGVHAAALGRYLGLVRAGIVRQATDSQYPGQSTMDQDVVVRSLGDVLAYLPRALVIFLLAPFPWQWAASGARGLVNAVSGLEALLVTGLCALAVWRRVGRGRDRPGFGPEAWSLLLIALAIGLPMAAGMPNLGTLVRLRLQALLPLALMALARLLSVPAAAKMPLDTLGGFLYVHSMNIEPHER